jgi:MYXO-CTERM domain-containing protein
MSLNIAGGVVASGSTWFPGRGANDGQLWINVVSAQSGPFTVFTLKETPTPTPGVLALLGLAGVAGRSRRRR